MTKSEYLAQIEEELADYLKAKKLVLAGAQSYSIGNRTIERPNLKTIVSEIKRLSKECMQLSRGGNVRIGRVVFRDL